MTTFWTVGHSTHSETEFVSLLNANGIECLAEFGELRDLANMYRTAYMCSEWTPAKCHGATPEIRNGYVVYPRRTINQQIKGSNGER